MNSNDVNSIIDNICGKLGTTASKLIPEMADYQITQYSIWMAVSLIFIGVAVWLTIRLLWMRKKNHEAVAIYPELIKKLDEQFKESGMLDEVSPWTCMKWNKIIETARHATTTIKWDESTWLAMILIAIWSGLIGIVIFGIALYHIIGWSIAPNASAFMWIIQQLGGGQ